MIVIDTSVAVPAALPWHTDHRTARASLPTEKTQAIGQVVIETYSVLTRLPPPQRVAAAVAWGYVSGMFEFPPLVLAADAYAGLLDLALAGGITGGAVYDAVVAATAVEADATLLTRDRRALNTYQRVGADYRFLE